MHYPPSPMKAPFPEDDTVQKRQFLFLFVFFLETKLYMWTILTSKCVWLCLFFYFRTLLWPQCSVAATIYWT